MRKVTCSKCGQEMSISFDGDMIMSCACRIKTIENLELPEGILVKANDDQTFSVTDTMINETITFNSLIEVAEYIETL